jgi:acyl-CoA synthetase (AMP-forming)/AMP-acid ligase II
MTTSESQPSHNTSTHVNVADRLARMAERMPTMVAVACPGHGDCAGKHSYATCTFEELDRDATALAKGLVELGVSPGMRLVLLVKPGIEFVKLVFALLRTGAMTILIDPGMGRKHLVNCLASAEPQGFVAIPAAQVARLIYRRRFPQAKLNVTVGHRWFWGGATFAGLLKHGLKLNASLPKTKASDHAAIIFTSGSTGPPKGVLYTHEMFETQVAEIQREYDLQPGGADLACFALFGLFNSAMGITTVFPDMNFSRPASADPRKLLDAANDWQVTQAFASPAVWDKLSRYCEEHGEQIPTLRKIFSCGAPVPASVLQRTLACVDAYAEMHTPYGATESLPVATIAASEVLSETASETAKGAGVCVGRKFDTVDWRIIRISDEPISSIDNTEELPHGEIGELIIRGPQVSHAYVTGDANKHNAMAKIADGNTIWHRMGDVGYFDEQQRFWYCGRKNQRVQAKTSVLYTECVEAIINTHPAVRRSALVGVGHPGSQIPIVYIEPSTEFVVDHGHDYLIIPYLDLAKKLLDLAKQSVASSTVKDVLFYPGLPVDVRHNSKINREELRDRAEFVAKRQGKSIAADNTQSGGV